ncbi:glycosyltransferase family 4 protein [Paenibacillus sp. MMS18-CY102]|uniref:glycosyltransferase family 4 protein n=1 Tax=Paenibacillus sp. MMS18-CY102 TaxID=2682849 RepID=UPI001366664F|nr:glycosyltransferase family 4 protein [Paenibacillus sp. MMS18-CY102]MWC28812.1 glycosyltransferase [Paenibacillus sp. MMS18-CY102]
MKMLFIFSVPSGGVETMNRLRCQALRQIGIEGHLLYLQDGAGRQNITDIPLFITNRDEDLANLLRTHQYAAIVSTCDHIMLQRLRGLGYTGPLLYEAQGLGTKEQAFSTLSNAAYFIRLYANGAITNKTAHLMELYNAYLHDFPRFYIQNIVDTNLFRHQPIPALNPTGQPILAWIGRIERNKNWKLFLQVGSGLARFYPGLSLWMCGDSSIYEADELVQFHNMVHKLNLGNRLTFHSNIPHSSMPFYLSTVGSSGGMLVSTSDNESFGYAASEALSCRCPVLSTDSDGIRSAIIHNVTGKFFSGAVHDAVCHAIELMENKAMRADIIRQGEQHIQTQFSPSRYVADFNNVLIAMQIKTIS